MNHKTDFESDPETAHMLRKPHTREEHMNDKTWFGLDPERVREWLRHHAPALSANTLLWIAVVLIHAATLPSLLSVMLAWTADMPQLDIVLLTWMGLAAIFLQSLITRNTLITVTVSVGFMLQAGAMALIFFR